VTKAIDSLTSLNKKLPAAEGARCRQVRVEDFGAVSRASNVPCPKNRGAQYQHPKHKSDFFSAGYPASQNICHEDVSTTRAFASAWANFDLT